MENYLKNEIIRSSLQNEITKSEFEAPLDEFIVRVHQNCYPNTYGKLFAKKLINESDGGLVEVNQNLDLADCYFTTEELQRKFCEVKISYINKNGKYRITNIRGYQNFDFFILSFVDMTDSFKTQCYIVPKEIVCSNPKIRLTPMNGTKLINRYNKYVAMSATLSKMDVDWLFGRHSILPNNKTKSLLKHIRSLNNNKVNIVKPPTSKECFMKMQKLLDTKNLTTSPRKPIVIHKTATKVGFNVITPTYIPLSTILSKYSKKAMYICGSTNMESVTDLIRFIGPKNILKAFWPSQISKVKTESINTPVGDGYYINPKFSFRDIQKMVRMINKKTFFNIEIVSK